MTRSTRPSATLVAIALAIAIAAAAGAHASVNRARRAPGSAPLRAQRDASASASYCGCGEPLDTDFVDPTCCEGHISAHMGDFSPFWFNNSVSYAAYGVGRSKNNATKPSGAPSPDFESVMVVDFENEVMFQSGAGYDGAGSWYFSNGSYLVLPVAPGESICLFSEGTFWDEIDLYAQSMWLNTYMQPRSNAPEPAHSEPNDFMCDLEKRQCAGGQIDVFAGMTLDTNSCGQRLMSVYGIYHDSGFVAWSAVEFPTMAGGVPNIAAASFTFFKYAPLNTYNWTVPPPLPASCASPLPLCAVLFPTGPFLF